MIMQLLLCLFPWFFHLHFSARCLKFLCVTLDALVRVFVHLLAVDLFQCLVDFCLHTLEHLAKSNERVNV